MKDFLLGSDFKSYLEERCAFALAPAGLMVGAVGGIVSLSLPSAGDHTVMVILSSLHSLKVCQHILFSKISIAYCQNLHFCLKKECPDLIHDLRVCLLNFGDMWF